MHVCAQAAVHSVVAGGKVMSVGMGCEHAQLPMTIITVKEIELVGSFRYVNTVRSPVARRVLRVVGPDLSSCPF